MASLQTTSFDQKVIPHPIVGWVYIRTAYSNLLGKSYWKMFFENDSFFTQEIEISDEPFYQVNSIAVIRNILDTLVCQAKFERERFYWDAFYN